MDAVSLLIKPASGLCNMECSYCFYKDELAHSEKVIPTVMNEAVTENLVRRICQETDRSIWVAFQGGEPTLAGLKYFQNFTSLMDRMKKPGCQIDYAIQTNGLLINDDWAKFLHKYRFLTGLSFDGTPWIHDENRRDGRGVGTAERVENAWKILRSHKVETNLLCVVTKKVAKKPEKIYRYLKQMGGRYLQFIPCIAPIGQQEATLPWSLTAEDYTHFLKALFDLWYQDWKNNDYVSIRQFDDYVNLMCGKRTSSCAACGRCGGYLVVESDGSMYPCDFFVEDKWYLGNIRDATLASLIYGDKMKEFLNETYKPEECAQCGYYGVCRGGCKNDYRLEADKKRNIYCRSYQQFFSYAGRRLQEIALGEMRMSVSR